jgi:transposase InsO family protein
LLALGGAQRLALARRVHRAMCLGSREDPEGLARTTSAAKAGLKAMQKELGKARDLESKCPVAEVQLSELVAEDVSGVLHELPESWGGLSSKADRLGRGLKVSQVADVLPALERMSRRSPCLIAHTEGHYLRLDKLSPEDRVDTPNQMFRFVVDWNLLEVKMGRRSWDPTRLVGRLDGEQRKLYEAEFELYRERGWWSPEGAAGKEPDGEATVFPVLSEGKTTKVRPVIDLRTINERGPRASNSRCRVNGAVSKMRGLLGPGKDVQQNDLSKAFYRIGTTKLWAIKTGVERAESRRLLFGLNVGPAALEAVLAELKGLVQMEATRLGVDMVELMDDYLLVGKREAVAQFTVLFDALLDACGFEVPESKREWWSTSETKWLGAYWTWDGKELKCRREVPEPTVEDWARITKRQAFQIAGQFPDITRTPGECQARVHMDLVRRLAGKTEAWDTPLGPKVGKEISDHIRVALAGWRDSNARAVLPWCSGLNHIVLRVDASQEAWGMELVDGKDNQMIEAGSRLFSHTATFWHCNRKESFALFQGIARLFSLWEGGMFPSLKLAEVETDSRTAASSPSVDKKMSKALEGIVMNRLKELICELVAHLRKKGIRLDIRHIEGKSNVVADRLSRPSDDLKRNATGLAELFVAEGREGGVDPEVGGPGEHRTRSGRLVRPADLFGEWSTTKRPRKSSPDEGVAITQRPEGEVRGSQPGEVGPATEPALQETSREVAGERARPRGDSDQAAEPAGQETPPGGLEGSAGEGGGLAVPTPGDDLDFEALVYDDQETAALSGKGWIRKRKTKRGYQWVTTTLWGRLRDGVWCPSYKAGSILVPRHMAVEVVRRAHLKGHPGKQGLRDMLSGWGLVVPGYERLHRQLFCDGCFRSKGAYAPRVGHLSGGKKPWTSLVMDLMEPQRGFPALVVLDRCTRWVEAYHLRSTTGKDMVDCLMQWIKSNGVPRFVQTDNGDMFTGRVFQNFLEAHCITWIGTAAYRPQGQGDVERKIRHLLESLRASMNGEQGLEFGEALGWACYHANRRGKPAPWDLARQGDDPNPLGKVHRDPGKEFKGHFKPGDLVWEKSHTAKKLEDQWFYRGSVVDHLVGNHVYKLRLSNGHLKLECVHGSHLKLNPPGPGTPTFGNFAPNAPGEAAPVVELFMLSVPNAVGTAWQLSQVWLTNTGGVVSQTTTSTGPLMWAQTKFDRGAMPAGDFGAYRSPYRQREGGGIEIESVHSSPRSSRRRPAPKRPHPAPRGIPGGSAPHPDSGKDKRGRRASSADSEDGRHPRALGVCWENGKGPRPGGVFHHYLSKRYAQTGHEERSNADKGDETHTTGGPVGGRAGSGSPTPGYGTGEWPAKGRPDLSGGTIEPEHTSYEWDARCRTSASPVRRASPGADLKEVSISRSFSPVLMSDRPPEAQIQDPGEGEEDGPGIDPATLFLEDRVIGMQLEESRIREASGWFRVGTNGEGANQFAHPTPDIRGQDFVLRYTGRTLRELWEEASKKVKEEESWEGGKTVVVGAPQQVFPLGDGRSLTCTQEIYDRVQERIKRGWSVFGVYSEWDRAPYGKGILMEGFLPDGRRTYHWVLEDYEQGRENYDWGRNGDEYWPPLNSYFAMHPAAFRPQARQRIESLLLKGWLFVGEGKSQPRFPSLEFKIELDGGGFAGTLVYYQNAPDGEVVLDSRPVRETRLVELSPWEASLHEHNENIRRSLREGTGSTTNPTTDQQDLEQDRGRILGATPPPSGMPDYGIGSGNGLRREGPSQSGPIRIPATEVKLECEESLATAAGQISAPVAAPPAPSVVEVGATSPPTALPSTGSRRTDHAGAELGRTAAAKVPVGPGSKNARPPLSAARAPPSLVAKAVAMITPRKVKPWELEEANDGWDGWDTRGKNWPERVQEMLRVGRVHWGNQLESDLRFRRLHPTQFPDYLKKESYGSQYRGKGYCGTCGLKGHTKRYCRLPNELKGRFMAPDKCLNCKRRGHIADFCDLPVLCRQCGEPGHQGRNCPNRRDSCGICGGKGHWTRDCLLRDDESPRGDKRGSDGEGGRLVKAPRNPADSARGEATQGVTSKAAAVAAAPTPAVIAGVEHEQRPAPPPPRTTEEMRRGLLLSALEEYYGKSNGATTGGGAEPTANQGSAPMEVDGQAEWQEFRQIQAWGQRPSTGGAAPAVKIEVPRGPAAPNQWVAWFVKELRVGETRGGGIVIAIEHWICLLDLARNSSDGQTRSAQALSTVLSIGGVDLDWVAVILEVFDSDALLLGWEGVERRARDVARRAWVRGALWDHGAMPLGGSHGYPAWVALDSHPHGGYFRHQGRSTAPSFGEIAPSLVFLQPGSNQKHVNEAAVRLMFASTRGQPQANTRQLRWLEANRLGWSLDQNDVAWLWGIWEGLFREGLRFLGRPLSVRTRGHMVGIEEPSKTFTREVDGTREVAVDAPGLGGGALGDVYFAPQDPGSWQSWLTNREIKERWVAEVDRLRTLAEAPCPVPRPHRDVLFRDRPFWRIIGEVLPAPERDGVVPQLIFGVEEAAGEEGSSSSTLDGAAVRCTAEADTPGREAKGLNEDEVKGLDGGRVTSPDEGQVKGLDEDQVKGLDEDQVKGPDEAKVKGPDQGKVKGPDEEGRAEVGSRMKTVREGGKDQTQ